MAHGLDTCYWKMREYIDEIDPDYLRFFEELYNIRPLDDTEPWYTEKVQERWNKSVNHSLWSSFEHQMGNPNTTEMIELSKSVTEGMPSIGIRDHMDSYWKDHFRFIEKLPRYVKEWIESIDTENIEPINKSLINSSDLFFNFNYTDILEKTYGIEEVIHIHGGVSSVCDIDPIMGHCNVDDIIKHKNWAEEADIEYEEAEASILNAVANYLEMIYKNTKNQINLYDSFFNKLRNVNHVKIIGWSGGDVDIPYLLEIMGKVSENAKWTVYWYNNNDLCSLKNIFKRVGITENKNVEFIQSKEFWD